MRPKLPLIALWGSQLYLVVALAVMSKLCFDEWRAFIRDAAGASGGLFTVTMNPAWVVAKADAAVNRLWWLCAAIAFGILLTALSTLWASLSRQVAGSWKHSDPERLG
jgi:hypothetical protein